MTNRSDRHWEPCHRNARDEQPALAADRHLLLHLLDLVVVDRDAAIAQVQPERIPMIAEVAQRFGDFLFRQDVFGRVFVEQFSLAFPDWLEVSLADSLTLGGRQAADSVFDVVSLLAQQRGLTG